MKIAGKRRIVGKLVGQFGVRPKWSYPVMAAPLASRSAAVRGFLRREAADRQKRRSALQPTGGTQRRGRPAGDQRLLLRRWATGEKNENGGTAVTVYVYKVQGQAGG
jgi:hypothetical protein